MQVSSNLHILWSAVFVFIWKKIKKYVKQTLVYHKSFTKGNYLYLVVTFSSNQH